MIVLGGFGLALGGTLGLLSPREHRTDLMFGMDEGSAYGESTLFDFMQNRRGRYVVLPPEFIHAVELEEGEIIFVSPEETIPYAVQQAERTHLSAGVEALYLHTSELSNGRPGLVIGYDFMIAEDPDHALSFGLRPQLSLGHQYASLGAQIFVRKGIATVRAGVRTLTLPGILHRTTYSSSHFGSSYEADYKHMNHQAGLSDYLFSDVGIVFRVRSGIELGFHMLNQFTSSVTVSKDWRQTQAVGIEYIYSEGSSIVEGEPLISAFAVSMHIRL